MKVEMKRLREQGEKSLAAADSKVAELEKRIR
jgi:hypothetical protein